MFYNNNIINKYLNNCVGAARGFNEKDATRWETRAKTDGGQTRIGIELRNYLKF